MAVRQLGQLLSDVMRVSGEASHVNEWEELAALWRGAVEQGLTIINKRRHVYRTTDQSRPPPRSLPELFLTKPRMTSCPVLGAQASL